MLMGEIAEMHLDGTLCEACGDFIGEPCGYPRYCSPKCAKQVGADYFDEDEEQDVDLDSDESDGYAYFYGEL